MVEGMNDKFTLEIYQAYPRSRQYIKLFGEIHFRNVDISFDKTKLSINRDKKRYISNNSNIIEKN